jgi:TnpA family transposase
VSISPPQWSVAKRFADASEEQGSTNEGVFLNNYLSDAEQRRRRRHGMCDELDLFD